MGRLDNRIAGVHADGARPDWGAHVEKAYGVRYRTFDDDMYAAFGGPGEVIFADWP